MVTIREILTLKKFSKFRLIAGEDGLDRKVVRGAFIDYESTENLKEDDITHEMMFSNLPMIKGHPEQIVDYVEALIDSGTACFAIKTTLFKEIPQEAIDLANKHNYPLFMFDDIFLDKLILDIDKLVNERLQLAKKVALIEKIQRGHLSNDEIRACVLELNRHFYKQILVYLIKKTEVNAIRFDIELARSLLGRSALIIPIDDKYMIIFSSELNTINKYVIVQKLGLKSENYHIGVSSVSSDHGRLGQLINESKIALKYTCFRDAFLKSFSDLGIYQILIPMLDQPTSTYFYEDIIRKIIDYDNTHQSDLLKTTIAYIQSDGNIKKTAESLFQHNNTIRFRIRKMKEIINLDEFVGVQYETLALAIHLYELDKKRYKFRSL